MDGGRKQAVDYCRLSINRSTHRSFKSKVFDLSDRTTSLQWKKIDRIRLIGSEREMNNEGSDGDVAKLIFKWMQNNAGLKIIISCYQN